MFELKNNKFLIVAFALLTIVLIPYAIFSEPDTPPYLEVDKYVEPTEIFCEEGIVTLNITGAGEPQIQHYPIDVMLVTDRSGSMGYFGKMDDAKSAAKTFVDQLNGTSDRSGLASFNESATLDQGLTFDKNTVKNAIDSLNPMGYTAIGEGIYTATDELLSNGREDVIWAQVLLSDGTNNAGRDPLDAAQNASDEGIVIYTIGLGPGANQTLLEGIANITGGKYYFAPTSDDLEEIYLDIVEELFKIAGKNVMVIDLLPAYVQLDVGSLPAECNYDDINRNITCDLGEMEINETRNITFNVSVNQPGNNRVNVYPDSGVNYIDFLGGITFIEFPETNVTVYGYPGATEICNDGLDNDCDELIDCEDPDCAGQLGPGGGICCHVDADCDDGVSCTVDVCDVNYECVNTPDDSLCDNNLYCDGVETCDAVLDCQPGTPVNCNDGVGCTVDSCNEDTDSCDNIPNDALCDDGLWCNGVETCDPTLDCQAGTPIDCDDGVGCTDDSCDEVDDECDHTPNDALCDDALWCNGFETCDALLDCQSGTPPDCDDGVSCTDDSCNEVTDSCDNIPNDANCDDALYCNGVETCDPTLDCQAGTPIDCSYLDDQCNDGVCDEGLDTCVKDPTPYEGLPCDDGLFCTDPDTCTAGVCGGPDRDCDDGVTCTVDSCDEVNDICVNTPNDALCDDGLYCNGEETCDPTLDCQAGTPVDCDDGVTCTVDSCNEDTDSCDNIPNDALCDDGLWCNGVEICDPILDCQAGTPVVCDDSNECTSDTCDEDNDQCIYSNLPAGTLCGLARDCPDTGCYDVYWEIYPVDGHDTCDGLGNCVQYLCDLIDSYCDMINCGAECIEDLDCYQTTVMCDYSQRKYCIRDEVGNCIDCLCVEDPWICGNTDDEDYCLYCDHFGDGKCNCNETPETCPEDCIPIKPEVCVWGRELIVDGINILGYRAGQYAFTNEQIKFNITVRDIRGSENIGYVKIEVDGQPEALCNPIEYDRPCNGFGPFDPITDKAFKCIYTFEPLWGWHNITIVVYSTTTQKTVGIHSEQWFFNPAIILSVETSDGKPIHFEPGGPGDWVHSENHIKVKNMGEGGLNLWMFIAGTDLYDITGAAKCPTTNKIDIEDWMYFRGWTGTISGNWTQMSEYDQDDGCNLFGTCYGGLPLPGSAPLENVLTNGGLMEVEFKLEYPVPCVGNFTQGSIFLFGKTI